MDVNEAISTRHSVRRYTDQPIDGVVVERLIRAIDEANAASGLSIQLVRNEPGAFSNALRCYGRFHNVSNYLAFVGIEGDDQDELMRNGASELNRVCGLVSPWTLIQTSPETHSRCSRSTRTVSPRTCRWDRQARDGRGWAYARRCGLRCRG